MKKIAIITGASSGMGKVFAETINTYDTFDEVWVIARRLDRLESLQETVPFPVRPIALDLTDRESFRHYAELLENAQANVQLLVNCSGYGKFQAACDTPLSHNLNMVDLNCEALMAMCQLTIPYMHAGAQIINIASVAACQPVPYIGVYAASKAFVLSYSRALNRELDDKDISVMAVCPFWTKTEFFDHAVIDGEKPVVKKYAAMYEPQQIVARAWRDAKRGKDVSKFGFIARAQMALVKFLPHSLIMDIWLSQQKL